MKFDIFNFNKPGLGVPDNEPELPRWRQLLKQFPNKFVQILGLNFLYLVFSIPSLIVAYFASFWVLGLPFDKFFNFQVQNDTVEMVIPRIILGLIMVIIPVVALGPVHAGFTYVFRNFSRQQHAYIWWDFKDHALANFKQGIIVTVINLFVVFVLAIAMHTYSSFNPQFTGLISYAATGFIGIAFAMFLCINLYIYPLMITYNMKISELYKVAYSFAFLRLIPNLLLLAGIIIVLTLAFSIIPWVGALLTIIILPASLLYLINYFVDPIIKKFEEEQDEEDENDENQNVLDQVVEES